MRRALSRRDRIRGSPDRKLGRRCSECYAIARFAANAGKSRWEERSDRIAAPEDGISTLEKSEYGLVASPPPFRRQRTQNDAVPD
jgi:hypothetical protein